ncbi:MAG: GIY-YIG nuclease family protein [Syntrophomonadaceae bacterium]|nr:GIY-YIG nuclease family protein [Syntrophomonadaceae bacterium]
MIKEFPGYNNVNIDYEDLKTIVKTEEPTWKNALSIMKGIYLIVDKSNGKQYVGSAYGEEKLWSRWVEYIKTGHGNNVGLNELVNEKGLKHVKQFKFSILEIAGINIDEEFIKKRETFWKEVLLSREFGYNKN